MKRRVFRPLRILILISLLLPILPPPATLQARAMNPVSTPAAPAIEDNGNGPIPRPADAKSSDRPVSDVTTIGPPVEATHAVGGFFDGGFNGGNRRQYPRQNSGKADYYFWVNELTEY